MLFSFLRKTKRDLHLVCGVSSSGKSYFLDKTLSSEKTTKVLMAYEVTEDNLTSSAIVHYNLFRPFGNKVENLNVSFLDDQSLRLILRYAARVRVTLLVLPRSLLAKRILLREEVEPVFRKSQDKYPGIAIYELLCRVDLRSFYDRWKMLFAEYNIPVKVLDSRDSNYKEILSDSGFQGIVNEGLVEEYTDDEVNRIVNKNRFEYQKIDISTTQVTSGQDRSSTYKQLPIDFKRKSVLDIGCAYGYFCFAAEKSGASRIVGTEQKHHRFIGSNIIKEIKGSACEFYWQDVFSEPLEEKFDYVLLLNVLHHLTNPIAALETAASLCNEKLVIEFPILSDEKFQATLSEKMDFDDSLPLIGVSQFKEQDQTFVFSSCAIERMIKQHKKELFSEIEFLPSPMGKSRRIAICTV